LLGALSRTLRRLHAHAERPAPSLCPAATKKKKKKIKYKRNVRFFCFFIGCAVLMDICHPFRAAIWRVIKVEMRNIIDVQGKRKQTNLRALQVVNQLLGVIFPLAFGTLQIAKQANKVVRRVDQIADHVLCWLMGNGANTAVVYLLLIAAAAGQTGQAHHLQFLSTHMHSRSSKRSQTTKQPKGHRPVKSSQEEMMI
jgi:hypothetical protein